MKKRSIVAAVGIAAASLVLTACSSSDGDDDSAATDGGTAGTVGVILPDSATSDRWETADRPALTAAFENEGVEADIQNAGGDKAKFGTLCDQMINEGVSALMIVNLDSKSGAACTDKAAAQGIETIDYDRLTLGGEASYYVSFDNVAVGTKIGEGLVKCMQDDGNDDGPVALLNGAPSDNNATLFKEGYEKVIKDSGYTITADQAVADWNNTEAGKVFEQMYTKADGDFNGVAAANDGLGGAAIAVLEKNGVAGKIPVTGQDATDEGLQRVLLGTQCMTVYKAIQKEADAAAALAASVARGETPTVSGTVEDTETGKDVPAELLEPQTIFPENVKDVVADGFTTVDRICTNAELKAACDEYGVA
jgi:D-xylose transport system substrate-binding protein